MHFFTATSAQSRLSLHRKSPQTNLTIKGAINSELPISSGEIESAHRYVILERLDIAGAWWTLDKAEQLLSLEGSEENQEWDDYWSELMPHAA